jgi:hypothetical protein
MLPIMLSNNRHSSPGLCVRVCELVLLVLFDLLETASCLFAILITLEFIALYDTVGQRGSRVQAALLSSKRHTSNTSFSISNSTPSTSSSFCKHSRSHERMHIPIGRLSAIDF